MLTFNESFSEQYIEALIITCKESKKTWEHFCKNVPMFNKNNGEKDIKIIAREVHKMDLCQVFRHFFLHNFFDCRI